MGVMGDLYRNRTDIDFPKVFRPMLVVSTVLVVASIVSLVWRGLNLSIEFEGGASWEIPSETLTLDQAESVLSDFGVGAGAKVQEAHDQDGRRLVQVQADAEADVSDEVVARLAEVAKVNPDQITSEVLGSETRWSIPSADVTSEQITGVLGEFGMDNDAKVDESTGDAGARVVTVLAKTGTVQVSRDIAARFAELADVDVSEVATNTVGPSWGDEITRQATVALVVFFIVIALYMSWQLEWRMAAAGLVAVVHDVLLTVGFYSIFGFEVTPPTVISFLTILGFSLYDTIVVYDRVRENAARYERSERYTYSAIVRRSLNQVFMRSLNTTVVAILPVIALMTIGTFIFNQPTLQEFSLALFIGLVVGAYSSVFIASPVVVLLKEREPRFRRIRERALERNDQEAFWIPPAHDSNSPIPAHAAATLADDAPLATVKAAQYQRPVPPRPRKQGKRR